MKHLLGFARIASIREKNVSNVPPIRTNRSNVMQKVSFFFGFRKRAEYDCGEYAQYMVSNTKLNEFCGPHRVPGRELSEFLSAY